jgi:bacillopeptidase F (M6 metalloprotease family)
MKKLRFLAFVLTLATLVLSACGAAAATQTAGGGAGKVEAVPVAFIGLVDSIAGSMVINGNTITVDTAVVRDGPFSVGDQVKVEVVNADGSFSFAWNRRRQVTFQSAPFGNENTNDSNTNDTVMPIPATSMMAT